MTVENLHIGFVAGEKSGDILGAGLIRVLRKRFPNARFSGLGGVLMQEAGLQSIANMERLSVMGLIEPLKRLPDLLKLRRELVEHFSRNRVDVLVTIDSPDFNLGLACRLRLTGIPCCHYVCPSVWAWRQGRVKKIRASFDHVLALLPFEAEFLARHDVSATFVGHPLAERIAPAQFVARSDTALDEPTLCVMPGSRHSEIAALFPLFLQTIQSCLQTLPQLQVIIPAATEQIAAHLRREVVHGGLSLNRIRVENCEAEGASVNCMQKADLVLLASGTATLEAALLGKPMVVAYRMSPLGFAIARRLVKVEHVALPNLLLNKGLVPECIQTEATPANLAEICCSLLSDSERRYQIHQELATIHPLLAHNASERAANVVSAMALGKPL